MQIKIIRDHYHPVPVVVNQPSEIQLSITSLELPLLTVYTTLLCFPINSEFIVTQNKEHALMASLAFANQLAALFK